MKKTLLVNVRNSYNARAILAILDNSFSPLTRTEIATKLGRRYLYRHDIKVLKSLRALGLITERSLRQWQHYGRTTRPDDITYCASIYTYEITTSGKMVYLALTAGKFKASDFGTAIEESIQPAPKPIQPAPKPIQPAPKPIQPTKKRIDTDFGFVDVDIPKPSRIEKIGDKLFGLFDTVNEFLNKP